MKKFFLTAVFAAFSAVVVSAQQPAGGLSPEMLEQISSTYEDNAYDKAISNALAGTSIATLAINADNAAMIDTHFSDRVRTKGITDQQSSGRCWLFTGMNVLRSKMINEQKLNSMNFSHVYLFFYDQLEKSNLFLENIIATTKKSITDEEVVFYLKNPVDDGGVWNLFYNLADKYGIVPADVMPETIHSNNTDQLNALLKELDRRMTIKELEALAENV